MTTSEMTLEEIGDLQLRVTRWFAAPPELVYRAHMDPEITIRWMQPPEPEWGFRIEDQGEGRYRYIWSHPDGEMPMTMQILETDPPHRIVHTELFDEDWTGGETRCETWFREQDGGTLLELTITYQSANGRATALASPMIDGMREAYESLEVLLSEIG